MGTVDLHAQTQRIGDDTAIGSTHDIIAIGASAGGVQVLLELVRTLPADFAAAMLVAVHIGARRSMLPELLDRNGPLPAAYGTHGEPVVPGRIYLAPPDLHLMVEGDHIALSSGPRENRFRPAIDPLFRSVAHTFGARAVGIVLSGALSDGTVGLGAIKAHGGITIVQDPADALIRGMPASALAEVNIDYVLTSAGIQHILTSLVRSADTFNRPVTAMNPERPSSASERIEKDLKAQAQDHWPNGATMFTCPECGGALWQVDEGAVLRFQCHVGHGWSWEAMLDQKSDQLESALWATSRLFVERAVLRRQIAARSERIAPDQDGKSQLERLAGEDEARAGQLQTMVAEMASNGSEARSRGESGYP
jgi:two-component system chemotaxis response regulator CheB